jgi:hypothetical protein
MALVRIDISEERITSIIRVKRISEVGTMLARCDEIIFTKDAKET